MAAPVIDADPRVTDAEDEHRAARDALVSRPEQARTARLAPFARVFGTDAALRNRQAYLGANPARQAASAVQTAKQAREEADLLRSLATDEAATRIEQTRAEEAAREARRAKQERDGLHDFGQEHRSTPLRDGPARGL